MTDPNFIGYTYKNWEAVHSGGEVGAALQAARTGVSPQASSTVADCLLSFRRGECRAPAARLAMGNAQCSAATALGFCAQRLSLSVQQGNKGLTALLLLSLCWAAGAAGVGSSAAEAADAGAAQPAAAAEQPAGAGDQRAAAAAVRAVAFAAALAQAARHRRGWRADAAAVEAAGSSRHALHSCQHTVVWQAQGVSFLAPDDEFELKRGVQ